MSPAQFKQVVPESLRDMNLQVYDPMNPEETAKEGEPKWSSDFQCGNLGPVFKIGERKYEIHLVPDSNEQQTV
jgi:hypothetical protein